MQLGLVILLVIFPQLYFSFCHNLGSCKTLYLRSLLKPLRSHKNQETTMKNITRFTIVPQTLYRIQPKLPVKLRDFDTQMAKASASFDLKLKDGFVHPAEGDQFIGPNGMSLRPASDIVTDVVRRSKETTIYTLICGLSLPDHLILLHEHTDHYSLQVRKPMSHQDFNDALTEFLKSQPSQTREQFIANMEDEDDYDM